MYLVCLVFIVFLFVVLTPSNFVRLPQNGNKWIVSIVHGIIFVTILHFTYHYYMSSTSIVEGLAKCGFYNKKCSTFHKLCMPDYIAGKTRNCKRP